MFDVTFTDRDFVENFIHKDAEWLKSAGSSEPDLQIDGLNGSFFWRLLARFQRSS